MRYANSKVFIPLSEGENDARLPQEGVKLTDLLVAATETEAVEAAAASSRRDERRRQEEEDGGTIFEGGLE